MLQLLLADRFKLRVHHAMKDLPVFNLVAEKGGPKFKEDVSHAKTSIGMRDGRIFRITAAHVPMADLIGELAYATGRPVMDKTGLSGFYDFEIAWSPRFARDDLAAGGRTDESPSDAQSPSVFRALQEQLGLKLEPGTAPFDTVVIDHAEKPSAN